MKKTTRKFAAFIAAMTLTACTMAPMSMVSYAAGNASVTITGIGAVEHTFEIYQVFTGTYNSTDGTFSALKWGTGVSAYPGTTVEAGELVDATIVSNLGGDARAILDKITTVAADNENVKTVTGSGESLTISELDDGYYIIKDVTNLNGFDDANSAYIVQVAADGKATSIAIKNETPTVQKEIFDDDDNQATGEGVPADGDNNGWGESADHAINETFQFRLTATIPVKKDLSAYDTYKVVFNDAMSSGVSFEDIESVIISSATLTGDDAIELTAGQYALSDNAVKDAAGIAWTLTIDDVKNLVNNNTLGEDGAAKTIFGEEEITIEVIYNAHLNENAKVDIASRSNGTANDTNNNMVYLQYSNNPDGTGAGGNDSLGETEKDYVWAFTYELNNTKYKVEVADGNELAGAKFQIKDSSGTVIKLIDVGSGNYKVADPSATVGENNVVNEMVSAADGKFNVIGLDAGTYTLVETEAPTDYNKADDVTVEIGATHKETSASTVDLYLTGINTGVENTIVDTMNNSLPSTGGIGTTLFVVGGSCLVALSGVYLISKKRAKNESAE